MKTKLSSEQETAIEILNANGVLVQELANGKWQAKIAPIAGYSFGDWKQFNSLMGVCDHYAKHCNNDWLYKFCAAV